MHNKVGKKYGRLSVISQTENRKNGGICFVCQCECGKTLEVLTTYLRNDKYGVKSCGCAKNDCYKSESRSIAISKKMKKVNEYIFTNDYVIGKTKCGEEFIFDFDDYEKVKQHRWNLSHGYVRANISIVGKNGKHKVIALHRLIMNFPSGKDIDHINHDLKDNRKSNLRICTHQQNGFNTRAKGYYFDKRLKKWRVRIFINYKTIHIGSYKTEQEAKAAREEAARTYFGEYRYRGSQWT